MLHFTIFNRNISISKKQIIKSLLRLVLFVLGLYFFVLYTKICALSACYTIDMIKDLNVPDWCIHLCQFINCPNHLIFFLIILPIGIWGYFLHFRDKGITALLCMFTALVFLFFYDYQIKEVQLSVFRKYGYDKVSGHVHEIKKRSVKRYCENDVTFIYTKDGVEHYIQNIYSCESTPALDTKVTIAVSKANPKLYYILKYHKKSLY